MVLEHDNYTKTKLQTWYSGLRVCWLFEPIEECSLCTGGGRGWTMRFVSVGHVVFDDYVCKEFEETKERTNLKQKKKKKKKRKKKKKVLKAMEINIYAGPLRHNVAKGKRRTRQLLGRKGKKQKVSSKSKREDKQRQTETVELESVGREILDPEQETLEDSSEFKRAMWIHITKIRSSNSI